MTVEAARRTREAYDLWAETYAAEPHNPLMTAEQQSMVRLLPEVRGRRVLDLACGTGRYARLLAAADAAEVIALDRSGPMLRRVDIGTRVQADMSQLPFATDAFDLVVSGLAVGHAPDLQRWMTEVARILRPGGTLLYSDFHPSATQRGLKRSFKDRASKSHAVPHFCHDLPTHTTAAAAVGLTVQVAHELRAGIEFREEFPGSADFYLQYAGTPLLLLVRAVKQAP